MTRLPSLQRAACDRRIPPLAWSLQIRAAHLLGAPRPEGTGTEQRRGAGGKPARPGCGFLWPGLTEGGEVGREKRKWCLRLETDLTYKITPDLRTLPTSPRLHELNCLFAAAKGREVRSAAEAQTGDSTQELAWLGEATLPPREGCPQVELPFAEYLLCIRHYIFSVLYNVTFKAILRGACASSHFTADEGEIMGPRSPRM